MPVCRLSGQAAFRTVGAIYSRSFSRIDNAVGHDRIIAAFGQAQRVEAFNIALDEADVRLGETNPVAVTVEVAIGDGELRRSRIHAGHCSFLA